MFVFGFWFLDYGYMMEVRKGMDEGGVGIA